MFFQEEKNLCGNKPFSSAILQLGNTYKGMQRAVVIGATGLTGGHLVRQLLALRQPPQVVCLVRAHSLALPLAAEQIVTNLASADDVAQHLDANTWVFCAIGTTMAKAGSQEAFRKVDYDIPLAAGRAAQRAGALGMSLVSSAGANARSFFFYPRIKGELEEALQAEGPANLHIYRPGLLRGKRPQVRLGEKMGDVLSILLRPLLIGPLAKYRAIKASRLAQLMVDRAHRHLAGRKVFEGTSL